MVASEEEPLDVDFEIEDDDDETKRRGMEAMYGPAFPLLKDEPTPDDWVRWAQWLWDSRRESVAARLHAVERNRLMRDEIHWISANGFGPWRPPPGPKDAVRYVHNMITPALDQRLEILVEQRPGFRATPTRQDPDAMKKAEGQQMALEYQYNEQGMEDVLREMGYWVGTDGVAFGYTNWDTECGPWHETMTVGGKQHQFQLGDPRTRVFRIEQVRVSPNATSTEKPYWWVTREEVPLGQAVAEHGEQVVEALGGGAESDSGMQERSNDIRDRYGATDMTDMWADTETTERFMVIVERSEYMPEGCQLVVVGNAVVFEPARLVMGRCPMWRMTDGSADPSFYPKPKMEQWISPQMATNAAISKWIESVRRNAGGQLLTRAGAVSVDTLVAGLMQIIEVTGTGRPIAEDVQQLPGITIGQDTINLIALLIKSFEDKSGWNDTSRGSFSASASGRSILATREALEKIFAPGVNAAAKAMTEWAKITLHWMAWGYDLPRTIALTGRGRPDLARELSSDDFDGVCDVFIDPETLMPMPRALRLFLLDSLFEKGAIGLQEYRRRMPFAFVQSIDTPDSDHSARAKRVVEALKRAARGEPIMVPPMLWQDNEAIHQDVLERDLILDDNADPNARNLANQRWMELANQQAMKMGMQAPVPAPSPNGGGKSSGMSPQSQPFLGTRPSIAASSASQMSGGAADQQRAGASFDAMSPQ
jgi:hypothetical protein